MNSDTQTDDATLAQFYDMLLGGFADRVAGLNACNPEREGVWQ